VQLNNTTSETGLPHSLVVDVWGNANVLWDNDAELKLSQFSVPVATAGNIPPTSDAGTDQTVLSGDGAITSGGSDTTNWQTYTGVIHIDLPKKGVGNFEYYSIDTAGNQEVTQTEVLQ